jgi:hypothetical protein
MPEITVEVVATETPQAPELTLEEIRESIVKNFEAKLWKPNFQRIRKSKWKEIYQVYLRFVKQMLILRNEVKFKTLDQVLDSALEWLEKEQVKREWYTAVVSPLALKRIFLKEKPCKKNKRRRKPKSHNSGRSMSIFTVSGGIPGTGKRR